MIRRREFITLLGGAATWPCVARAQKSAMPVIGFLHGQSAASFSRPLAAFHEGLGSTGFVEQQNVRIEYRWADGDTEKILPFASQFVREPVEVIVAVGSTFAAARSQTTTIPIVATFGGDPVQMGIVASLNRPGGNTTGVSVVTSELEGKRLELMHELLPTEAVLGVLIDANFSAADSQRAHLEDAAHARGIKISPIQVGRGVSIEDAFTALHKRGVAALVVTGSPLFVSRHDQLVALAAKHRIPTIYENRETVAAGGLMSYGTNIPDVYRLIGIFAGRILKGAAVGELPVMQATKVDVVVNLKTAKALGLEMPTSILLRANEVIE